jgi:DNA-3-methyladenine glycosylase II
MLRFKPSRNLMAGLLSLAVTMTARSKQEATDGVNSLCYDPRVAVRRLTQADPVLGALMKAAGPFTLQLRTMHSTFEALARNIIYQQLHGTAAAAIHARVVALGQKGKLRPQTILSANEDTLRGAGLSRAKLAALQDLAAKTLDGTVPSLARLRRMSDEEIIARLTSVRGIGRWTVEMLLMSRLGRGDVLPTTDLGVRKGFAFVYQTELPTPKALAEYGERWRPFRTVASWYMWRALELPAGAWPPEK